CRSGIVQRICRLRSRNWRHLRRNGNHSVARPRRPQASPTTCAKHAPTTSRVRKVLTMMPVVPLFVSCEQGGTQCESSAPPVARDPYDAVACDPYDGPMSPWPLVVEILRRIL